MWIFEPTQENQNGYVRESALMPAVIFTNPQKIDLSDKMVAVRGNGEAHPSIPTGNQFHPHTTVAQYVDEIEDFPDV
jgi:hypothetical protein